MLVAKKTSLFGIKSPFALGPMAVSARQSALPKQAAAEKKAFFAAMLQLRLGLLRPLLRYGGLRPQGLVCRGGKK